jgi:adenosylhomocysteine nucleosidase
MQRSLLVVMALEVEAQGRLGEAPLLFTGVGKVNAAHRLTRRLLEERREGREPLVVNFGTAGSRRFRTGAIVACRRFVQRDMDVTSLGFAAHETPFENVPRELEFPEMFPALEHGVCGSGDRFEAVEAAPSWDLVDMEAYALAKVCFLEQVPYASAAIDWQANLPRAAEAFAQLFSDLRDRVIPV